ncbi:hypothetical protein MN608_07341 [Microdochium nivale]|nr:hypothetical protein MN608_07341 [Microdochium nivale]
MATSDDALARQASGGMKKCAIGIGLHTGLDRKRALDHAPRQPRDSRRAHLAASSLVSLQTLTAPKRHLDLAEWLPGRLEGGKKQSHWRAASRDADSWIECARDAPGAAALEAMPDHLASGFPPHRSGPCPAATTPTAPPALVLFQHQMTDSLAASAYPPPPLPSSVPSAAWTLHIAGHPVTEAAMILHGCSPSSRVCLLRTPYSVRLVRTGVRWHCPEGNCRPVEQPEKTPLARLG